MNNNEDFAITLKYIVKFAARLNGILFFVFTLELTNYL